MSSGAPQDIVIGTVPLTDTWLIANANVYNAGGVNVNFKLYATDSTGIIQVFIMGQSLFAGGFTNANLQRFVALGPGDLLRFSWDQPNCHIWVSGADLPGHL